jgi:UDP-N-acetylglucosamine acyltransferase
MIQKIHASSVIEDGAILGEGVEIGPFCHVGSEVKLGDGAKLLSHVSIAGNTDVGARTKIFPTAVIGHEPQDLKYRGEKNQLIIGEDCLIREGVTIHPGTEENNGLTQIGNHCVFLACSHIAHDCMVGNNVILSNNVMLAGHVTVEDFVIFGGASGAHQFCRIGHHAFIGGMSGVEHDVIPYGLTIGNRATLRGLNLIGMKRNNIPRESIKAVQNAYGDLFKKGATVQENAKALKVSAGDDQYVADMLNFVLDERRRQLCVPE